jgi:uncharacterized protein (DUF1015 family)
VFVSVIVVISRRRGSVRGSVGVGSPVAARGVRQSAVPTKVSNVPVFLPFRGLRYCPLGAGLTDLSAVAAPPYDVIHGDERDDFERRDPHNAVRLILPRPADGAGAADEYEAAAGLLATWRADGVLATDAEPAFYGYRMVFTDSDGHERVTHGVVGALGLPAGGPGTGDILPHERTIPRHRTDRLSLLRATRANLDPIWGLSGAAGLAALVGGPDALDEADERTAVDDDGVRHTAWPITDAARIDAIRDAVSSGPLVLADGHHRFETACAYRAERPAGDTGADAIMALVVELADDELWVAPIHRLVHDPVPHTRLEHSFTITPMGANTPEAVTALEHAMADAGAMGLIDGDGLALLVPRVDVVTPLLEVEPPEARGADAAVFEVAVMPRLDGAPLEYRSDAHTVADLVRRGDAAAAFLLRPVSVAEIRAASYAGVRMPQKTTFFAPKPRTGLVFRSLDD